MNDEEFFDLLDLDRDGKVSRQELQWAAALLGWQWHEAPIFALLDFLTIRAPLDKETFIACVEQVSQDPDGLFGEVLRQGPQVALLFSGLSRPRTGDGEPQEGSGAALWQGEGGEEIVEALTRVSGEEAAAGYSGLLRQLELSRVRAEESALLVIDPQRSFTSGVWMSSMGPAGEAEVQPIRSAFRNCAKLLGAIYRRAETMFTRCPFPPESYGWDEGLDDILSPDQPYFIKPGNSVLRPLSNGYREWVEALIREGKKTLVLGGCTLNSCLRVSAVETRRLFSGHDIEVIADLSLCAARASNYLSSPAFGGRSSVQMALEEIQEAGVRVARGVEWVA